MDKNALEFLLQETIATHQPRVVDIAGADGANTKVLVVPKHMHVQQINAYLDQVLEKPRRKSGRIVTSSLDHFVDAVNTHGEEGRTTVFVDPRTGSAVAIVDFHGPDGSDPGWCALTVEYPSEFSEQWLAWAEHEKRGYVDQKTMCAFIEDRIADIAEPPPAKGGTDADQRHRALTDLFKCEYAERGQMLQLSRGMRVMTSSTVEEILNPNTGEISATVEQQHQDPAKRGKGLKVAGLFMLHVPIFARGDLWRLPCRLKYRVDGSVTWSIQVVDRPRALEQAVQEILNRIVSETEVLAWFGDYGGKVAALTAWRAG